MSGEQDLRTMSGEQDPWTMSGEQDPWTMSGRRTGIPGMVGGRVYQGWWEGGIYHQGSREAVYHPICPPLYPVSREPPRLPVRMLPIARH